MNVAFSAGTRLGRYEIRSPIGVGGMGEVYLAHDMQLHRPVALKVLPSNLTNDEERLRRRMDIDGGNLKQLVSDGNGQEFPSISPDGRWVLYGTFNHGVVNLTRVPIEGGEPVKLTDTMAQCPIASPDGKLIACLYWNDQANPPYGVGVLPFEGGQFIKTFDIVGNAVWPAFRWTLDGRALMYVDRSMSNIWSQPLDGGPPKRLTNFTSESIFWFDLSRDGKSFALARGNSSSDVVLISNFR